MGDWSQIPDDLLCAIVRKFNTLEDFIRSQAVCPRWRFALKHNPFLLCSQQLPWLMLPYFNNNQNCRRGIFNISNNKVHHLELPEAYGSRCCGSSHGWLAMIEDTSPSIFLLNPFTKQRIELPPMTGFPDILDFRSDQLGNEYVCLRRGQVGKLDEYSLKSLQDFYMQRVILSADPTTKDCVVMAICGEVGHLGFCRPGDKRWTLVPQPENHGYDHVIYWRNQFYAVDSGGSVVVCDIGVSPPKETIFIQRPSPWIRGHMRYLAINPSGELLLVVRYWHYDVTDDHDANVNGEGNDMDYNEESYDADGDEENENVNGGGNDSDYNEENYYDDDDDSENETDEEYASENNYILTGYHKTSRFDIYKLDEESKNWRKVNGLGDYLLFLGNNHAICLLADDFPQCKRNCIYFTDDYLDAHLQEGVKGYDIGIFNLKDKSIEPFPCCPDDTLLIWCPPIWVTPSLSMCHIKC